MLVMIILVGQNMILYVTMSWSIWAKTEVFSLTVRITSTIATKRFVSELSKIFNPKREIIKKCAA